jgi:hypothetical protein
MENNAPICPKCNGAMQDEFMVEYRHGTANPFITRWAAGPPVKRLWWRSNAPAKKQIPIITFRCMRCGFLESHAWRNSTQ